MSGRPFAPLARADGEIRLLTIHAGVADDPITCSLNKTALSVSETPSYETISYTWGDLHLRSTISVNGVTLEVPSTALAALRCVRLPRAERVIWIDSVCIDQDNVEERNHQVSAMAKIYCGSERNLIFLGSDGRKAREAFRSIDAIAEEARKTVEAEQTTMYEYLFNGHAYFWYSEEPLECDVDVEALYWLFDLRWHTRLWVFQEAVLAPRNLAICESESIDFDSILAAANWLLHKSLAASRDLREVANLRGLHSVLAMWLLKEDRRKSRTQYAFSELLWRDPLGDCSDLRDQVYGLVGLYQERSCESLLPRALIPDYTKTAVVVLRDATRYVIEEGRNLAIWQTVPVSREDRPAGLPSWVSEWFRYKSSNDPGRLPEDYQARGSWRNTVILEHPSEDVLRLKGVVLGYVEQHTTDALTLAVMEDIPSLLRHVAEIQTIADSVGHPPIAIGETLTGKRWYTGQHLTKEQATTWTPFMEHIVSQRRLPSRTDLLSPSSTEEEKAKAKNIADFIYSLILTYVQRRFFSTSSGHIGIGPADTRVGDAMVILQGGNMPFVLRASGDEFTLIGPAFMHGVMNGEWIEISSDGEADPPGVAVFDIR